MNSFGALFKYEWKKLILKKIVWLSFTLCLIGIVIAVCSPIMGEYYLDGDLKDTNYNSFLKDKGYYEALNGREINQSLLEETLNEYKKIPYVQGSRYSVTEEYQKYARPYSAIFAFIRNMTRMTVTESFLWTPSEDDLYMKRQDMLEKNWKLMYLSDGEVEFWQNREDKIQTPYVYNYHEGYTIMITAFQTIGILLIFLISICLSGIFPDEYTKKTDQIILCSRLGKSRLYLVKIITGISFATIATIIFFLITLCTVTFVYGIGNFHTAFQFIYSENSDPISCGQAVLISYAVMLITGIVVSIIVMVVSEILHSNIAGIAISSGLLIASMMINIPEQYRILSQVWRWQPWAFLSTWNVFDYYTLKIFYQYLTPWQAVPIIYVIVGIIAILIGKQVYKQFQISGR